MVCLECFWEKNSIYIELQIFVVVAVEAVKVKVFQV